MFFLDLKRADAAIGSGRLDDAFELLQNSAEREHRDGQRLIDRLADALLQRATLHLHEGRPADARQDTSKLLQLAGRTPNTAALLHQISLAEQQKQDSDRQRRDILATVDEQVRAGAYTLGAKLLGPANSDDSAGNAAAKARMARSIEAHQQIVATAADRIQAAVDAGQFDVAIHVLAGLKPEQRRHAAIATQLPSVVEPVLKRGRNELAHGRLDRATATVRMLEPLSAVSADIQELQQCLSRCGSIHKHVAQGRLREAEAELRLLAQVVGECNWITEARDAVAAAIGNLNSVLSGPLGLLTVPAPSLLIETNASTNAVQPESPLHHHHSDERRLPTSCVLQVDGLGSLLLLTSDVVTIGAAARASTFDIAVMTEGETVPITVRRSADDYFAESEVPFVVNGQRVTRRLLATGDTLAVGNRGRLRFVKPVPASNSAVLQITGSRLVRRDIRSVVLMADSLLFGPQASHFRLPSVDVPIVLHRDRSGYALRQLGTADECALRQGGSAVINDVRFGLVET